MERERKTKTEKKKKSLIRHEPKGKRQGEKMIQKKRRLTTIKTKTIRKKKGKGKKTRTMFVKG